MSAWEMVGTAPCTRKCLSDWKVSKSLGDGDDEHYNLSPITNKIGYAGNLLAVKIEDDRDEAVPLTQPLSKSESRSCGEQRPTQKSSS